MCVSEKTRETAMSPCALALPGGRGFAYLGKSHEDVLER
jgi:hypothetical protein